jgi:hypothetical protein
MLNRHPVSLLALAAAVALGPLPARAALDPELDKPYKLQVVLDVAEERVFTPTFVSRVQRDLQDLLQADFGALARVKVVRTHPLLREVRAKGLGQVLNGYHRVSDVKVHFVRIGFTDGSYDLQARQYDGLTGLASPRVHRDRTPDRQLVARTAALLVSRDFGLVGTVDKVEGAMVTVALKGGGLGVPLRRWVDVNDVFAVAQVSRSGSGLQSARVRWALLQVSRAPDRGRCLCRYYHRFQDDTLTGQPDVLGYRCLRLATVRGPLRIRFLDFKTHAPLDGLQVHVGAAGFQGTMKRFATNDKGLLPQTEDTYANVAFVKVMSGGEVRARIPVAMLDDRTLDCLVSIRPGDEERAQKRLRRDRWLRRLYDDLRVAADRVADLNELGKKSLREDALARARAGLQSLKAELQSLHEEHDRLRREDGLDLAEGEQRLADLEKRRQELDHFVTRLDQILKEEKDPRRRELLGMIEQARLLETQAEFGQALALYDKVLAADPKQTKVAERRGRLSRAWAIPDGDEAHRKARALIYEAWPKAQSPQELEKGLAEVRKAFEVCRRAGDALSPQKILRADVRHSDSLTKRLASLRPRSREDDRKEAAVIARVAEGLKKLHEEVAAYLKAAKPAFP